MQIKQKLMNQTWEDGEKPNFGPDFVASYHGMQCKKNIWSKLKKMAKNLILGLM